MPAKPYNTVEKTWYLAELEIPLSEIDNYTLDELHEMYKVRDIYPGVLISLEKDGFAANAVVTATDNGDGGVTLATTPSSKFPKYAYAEATYFKIANAVQLAINPPQPPSASPSAGVTQRAAREDHVHQIPTARPYALRIGAGAQVTMGKPGGSMTSFQVGRAQFCAIYLMRPSRALMNFSKISFNVTSAAGAGGVARIAMWKSTADADFDWTNKVFESGAISTTTTGMKDYVVSLTNIVEGVYWIAFVPQVSNCSITGAEYGMQSQGGNPSQMTDYFYQDGITGAFPSTPSPNNGGDGQPALYFTFA